MIAVIQVNFLHATFMTLKLQNSYKILGQVFLTAKVVRQQTNKKKKNDWGIKSKSSFSLLFYLNMDSHNLRKK